MGNMTAAQPVWSVWMLLQFWTAFNGNGFHFFTVPYNVSVPLFSLLAKLNIMENMWIIFL